MVKTRKYLFNTANDSVESNENFTEKTVSLNQRNISLIYGQKKFFELKKVLLIQKKFLQSKEIDLFKWKTICLNQQNFL